MKKSLLYLITLFLISGCDQAGKSIQNITISQEKLDLFKETDKFVESLDKEFESYGLLGGQKYTTTTADGKYRIMPTGRLINVKINEAVSNEVYEELRADIEDHYKEDKRVNDVYICKGGTVMIDCRNKSSD